MVSMTFATFHSKSFRLLPTNLEMTLNLGKIVGATYCPTDGHANPFKTTFAYAEAAL
jgi:glycine/D-amino acid oxidase-like deaminating enzyme